jgi:hypothetical protein
VIQFWCSGCGHDLAAEDARAGKAMACPGCGLYVDVPDNPPPLEAITYRPPKEDEDGEEVPRPVLATEVAATADAGLRDLQRSLLLFLLSFAVSVPASVWRAARDGIDAIIAGDPASSRGIVIAQTLVGIAFASVAAYWRFRGYGRCQKLSRVLRAEGGLPVAIFGAAATGLGTVLAGMPACFASSPPVPDVLSTLFTMAGGLLSLVGFGAEFAALGFFGTLIRTLGHPLHVRRVRDYIYTFAAVGIIETFLTCAGYLALVFLVFRPRPGAPLATGTNPGGWVGAVPDEAIPFVIAAGLFVALSAMSLCWQYWRILAAGRAAVKSTSPELPRPEAS